MSGADAGGGAGKGKRRTFRSVRRGMQRGKAEAGAQRLGVITMGQEAAPNMTVGRGVARRGEQSDRTEKEGGHE